MEVGPSIRRKCNALASCFLLANLLGLLFLASGHDVRRLATRDDNIEAIFNRGLSSKIVGKSLFRGSIQSLQSRAGELTFKAAADKGAELMCLMEATKIEDVQNYLTNVRKRGLATSEWVKFEALDQNGWRLQDKHDPGFDYELWNKIFDVDTKNHVYQEWLHDVHVSSPEGEFEKTGARYANLYNPKGGLIAADENYGINTKLCPSPYVPLRQWADIVFLAWQKLCADQGAPVGGLTRIFQISVAGADSQDIITQALTTADGGSLYSRYKNKVRFPAGSLGFLAILGSVNGLGQAWLLIQHRPQMGHLTIKAIYYFRTKDEDEWCLEFEIGPFTTQSDPPKL